MNRSELVDLIRDKKVEYMQEHGSGPTHVGLTRSIRNSIEKWDANELGGEIAGRIFFEGVEASVVRISGLDVHCWDADEVWVGMKPEKLKKVPSEPPHGGWKASRPI